MFYPAQWGGGQTNTIYIKTFRRTRKKRTIKHRESNLWQQIYELVDNIQSVQNLDSQIKICTSQNYGIRNEKKHCRNNNGTK